MRKSLGLVFLCVGILPLMLSVSVDEAELKAGSGTAIEFINYVGPHKVINSLKDIKDIGETLGGAIRGASESNWNQKYRIQRFHDPDSPKLGADLFILEPSAGVDHIRNLNLIVAGYLETAFGYSAKDALLVADFITRYNAVYRGKIDHFIENFIPQVSANLSAENAGLSRAFFDWPGKTRMVIPLRDTISRGENGLVNAEEISNPQVIEQLKKDETTALEDRKAMTDLKEREIAQENAVIAQRQEDLKKREEEVDRRIAENQAENSGTTDAKVEDGKSEDGTSGQAGNVEATGQKDQLSEAARLQEEKTRIEEEKKNLAEAQKENAKRDAELQKDREDIAKEEEARLNEKTNAAASPNVTVTPVPVVFLKVEERTSLGELQIIDTKGLKVLKRSTLNTIRGKRFELFQNSYLVIAGREGAETAVRLFLLKKDDLSVSSQGTVDINPDASLFMAGSQFFTVIKDSSGSSFLGLFDAQLKLLAQSSEAVQPNTLVSQVENTITVQGKSGKVLFLDSKTLKKTGESNG